MVKKKFLCCWIHLCVLLGLSFSTAGQDSLLLQYNKTTTDEKKVQLLNDIINSVLTQDPQLGDSLAGVMLQVAEFSRNRGLMCKAYSNLAHQYVNYAHYRNNAETGEKYADKALDLAKANGLEGAMVQAYIELARINRFKSNNQKALGFNNLALTLATTMGNDSIISVCYTGLSDTWLSMNDKLSSFQNSLSAREFAEKSNSAFLIVGANLGLASFYTGINEDEKAKDLCYRAIALGRQNQLWEYVMVAQTGLAEIYGSNGQKALAMSFYNDAMKVADSVGRSGYKVNIYYNLLDYFVKHETAADGLQYVKSRPDFLQFLRQSGQWYVVERLKGFDFSSKKEYDSADYYFKNVLQSIEGSNNWYERYLLYSYLSDMYRMRSQPDKQFLYLQKSQGVADSADDIEIKRNVALALDSFYRQKGDYQKAFFYSGQFNIYKDSLRKLSEQKDLLGLEIDNENKRKAREEEVAIKEKERRNNIQYLGITAAIATVFILLVLSGAFKMSIPVIKALGFFAFIFLFEFIILLADNVIHEWTHGEPWKVMGFKIVLVGMLLPFHHWLEHKVIHYLLTHDMLPKKSFQAASSKEKELILKEEEEI